MTVLVVLVESGFEDLIGFVHLDIALRVQVLELDFLSPDVVAVFGQVVEASKSLDVVGVCEVLGYLAVASEEECLAVVVFEELVLVVVAFDEVDLTVALFEKVVLVVVLVEVVVVVVLVEVVVVVVLVEVCLGHSGDQVQMRPPS